MAYVEEVVLHGSPYLSLKKEFITEKDLLYFILEKKPNLDLGLLAFRAVLRRKKNESSTLYLNDEHFLKLIADLPHGEAYGALYLACGGDVDAPISLGSKSSKTIAKYLIASTSKLYKDKKFQEKIEIIAGTNEKLLESLTPAQTGLAIRAGNIPPDIDPEVFITFFLNVDWVKPVADHKDNELFSEIIQRGHYLIKHAPHYWEQVAKKVYQVLVETQIANRRLLLGTTKKDLLEMLEIFPEVKTELSSLSELAYLIALKLLPLQAYLLGFPIQYGLPGDKMIWSALQKLSAIGKEQYAKLMREEQEKITFIPSCFGSAIERNEKDVLEEFVYDYGPFDRLTVITGMNLYHFTRKELHNILENGQNIYTKEELVKPILEEAKRRLKIAKEWGLPEPAPLLALLEKVEKGTLHKKEGPPKSQNQNRSSGSRPPLLPQMLPSFFQAMMMGGDPHLRIEGVTEFVPHPNHQSHDHECDCDCDCDSDDDMDDVN